MKKRAPKPKPLKIGERVELPCDTALIVRAIDAEFFVVAQSDGSNPVRRYVQINRVAIPALIDFLRRAEVSK